jgi:hypothetical protein
MLKVYEKGDLVMHRALYHELTYGIGIVTSYDKWVGLYKVFWPNRGVFDYHVQETLSRLDCD